MSKLKALEILLWYRQENKSMAFFYFTYLHESLLHKTNRNGVTEGRCEIYGKIIQYNIRILVRGFLFAQYFPPFGIPG